MKLPDKTVCQYILQFFALVIFLKFTKANRPVVHTKLGVIRGVEASDGDYNMYMSVPYGKVNLSNPFGPAVPINKYEDVIEADKDSLSCMHMSHIFNSIVGKLDCLELNIYVPKVANESNLLPVIAYLFGGIFMFGTANRTYYGPKFLVKHDIILVTVEFRNGPYGFMCLDTPEVPGNQGLKDQILALQWIQANIKAFGGDPDKVTLSGESSGSVCAHFHYIYGPEKLFDKVILASGSAYTEIVIGPSNQTVPLKIAEAAGFKTNNLTEALNFISNLDPRSVIRISNDFGMKFKPCIEKQFENVTNFMTEYPAFVRRNRSTIPILIGHTVNETLFSNNESEFYDLLSFIKMYLTMGFNFDKNNFEDMSQLVESFYSHKIIDTDDIEQKEVFFGSDYIFFNPTLRTVKESLEYGGKLFIYLFTYFGQRDYMKRKKGKHANTTVHGDEIGYLFDMALPFINQTHITKKDQLIIDRFTMSWANFVKFGDPTPITSSLLPIKWKRVTKKSLYCMVIDSEVRLIKRPLHSRTAFWELFYDVYGKNKIGYREIEDDV